MYHHIPPPPHSAGLGTRGPRPRVEPTQVPSPIDAAELDRAQWEHEPFMTLPGKKPPLATTEFTAVDQGNSNPKFARVSTWGVPNTARLASDCHVPMAAVFQPFAQLDPREEEVLVVDAGAEGPQRCERCRAYINPWVQWMAGGNRWKCNLCSHETAVTPEYFCHLDVNGYRMDHLQRPELNKGTIDFIVGEDYWASHPPKGLTTPYFAIEPPHTGAKAPQPMNFLFAFDVSHEAVECGLLRTACTALLTVLYGVRTTDGDTIEPCFPPGSQVAILTFDRTIQFYNLSSDLVPMLVVPDLEEVFLPLKHGLFVDPNERREAIIPFLETLPSRYQQTTIRDTALGAAVVASVAAMAGRGGHAVIFQSAMPQIGPGALTANLRDQELKDTDQEKALYKPRDIFWASIAESCSREGVGVSLFVTPSQAIDLGSIGVVASFTGGELFFYPRFKEAHDGPTLISQFRRLISRTQAYNCTMRVRCSKGLRVSAYRGNFVQSAPTDVDFGVLDADKSVSVTLEHTGKLNTRDYAFIQAAVLYTTVDGQRRVRMSNLALQIVELPENVFAFADSDVVACHFVRQALTDMPTKKLSELRSELMESIANVLLGYRTQCATSQRSTQLVIPEAFRGLPAYVLGAIKSKPLKGRMVAADVRNYAAHKMMSMDLRSLVHYLYPPLLAVHDLTDEIALPDGNGEIKWPSCMRSSHLWMQAHGVYLLDNGDVIIFWIGSAVSPQVLRDLFDIDDASALQTNLTGLPVLQTRLSAQVRNILAHREQQRGRAPKMYACRQNLDAVELDYSDMLVEDANNAAHSYVEFLTALHNQISNMMNGSDIVYGTNFGRSPW